MASGPSWADGERQIIRDHWDTEDDGELADRIRDEVAGLSESVTPATGR